MTTFSCRVEAALDHGLTTAIGSGRWIDAGEGIHVTLRGTPRWTDPALERTAAQAGPEAAVVEAYRAHQADLFRLIRGAFSLVVVDEGRRQVTGGVDRFSRYPLFHSAANGALSLGTTAADCLQAAGSEGNISHQHLFEYLYFHMVPAPGSIFAGISKLQGAHAFVWTPGRMRVAPYWVPEFSEPETAEPTRLHEHVRQAVFRTLGESRSGAFLSGGLDSSTVAGMLAAIHPGEADTFSIGFDAPGYDEMAYARIAVQHFGTRPHEYYVTPADVVSAVSVIAAAYDEPFGNSSALPAWFCARMAAAEGVSRLLAGDGGDELFAGNERYAKQAMFEYWLRVPEALRTAVLEPVLVRLPRRPAALRKARSYVEQARVPLPDRLQRYNFLHRIDPASLLAADFLETVDVEAPLALQREIFDRPRQASPLNRMMYLDWQITLADNDLRKVSRMCELAGVEVVFPMLDDDLVDFSLEVPSRLKLRNRRLRHFYKEAMRGFLPGAIIDKQKHGFGLPFGVWMREHRPLRELAYDSLGDLRHRHYFQPGFLDRVMDLHGREHAGYWGELIWVLMMLEVWLRGRRPRTS